MKYEVKVGVDSGEAGWQSYVSPGVSHEAIFAISSIVYVANLQSILFVLRNRGSAASAQEFLNRESAENLDAVVHTRTAIPSSGWLIVQG